MWCAIINITITDNKNNNDDTSCVNIMCHVRDHRCAHIRLWVLH